MKFIRYFKDVMRFNQLTSKENKICFYSEGENYWPHLKPIITSLLETSDVPINYVTSDENDPGLQIDNKLFNTFVIGSGFIRNYFFDNLNSQLVIMTMPDLDQYQIKKSKNVGKFIYIHHSLVSHHMVYRPKAFDAFDVIFCAGKHHNRELVAMSAAWGVKQKKVINHGYGRLDSIIKNQQERVENKTRKILIAPSWGVNGTIEYMGERLVDELMKLPYEVILRPHPQTRKFASNVVNKIVSKYKNNQRFKLDEGVASEKSLHESDLMISDWSGAALDYAFGLLKPVLFIDVPQKIQNPNFAELKVEPYESSVRNKVGLVQSTDLKDLAENVAELINSKDKWQSQLSLFRNDDVYNVGNSGQVAAKEILELL